MRAGPSCPHPNPARSLKQAVFLSSTFLLASCSGGCSDSDAPGPLPATTNNLKQIGLADQSQHDVSVEFADGSVRFLNDQVAAPAEAPATPKSRETDAVQAPERGPAIPRKIIYDARIELLVKSLEAAERAVLDLIKDHDGFLAESNIAAQIGTQRDATWRVRVPVDHFDSFVSAVGKLGEVRTNHVGTQDVTEAFADLEARIRNKQAEEKRLLKHLADSTGKLEDILNVERELSRVRGEVEQMQGRLRFLANRADLSTVTITATEWKDYTPPAPMTFQAQISHSFFHSLDALVMFGKNVLLLLVALIPWTPLIVIGLFVLLWLIRAERRASATRMARVAPSPPRPT
jgi:Domain of unknown function (DUF4349)